MAICVLAFLVIIVSALMRGGKGEASIIGVDTCSATAWVVFVVSEIVVIGCSFLQYLKHRKRLAGAVYTEGTSRYP